MSNNSGMLDYIIVGQGLSGSFLAYNLIKESKKFVILEGGLSKASLIAGGIFSPLTGRQHTRTWLADELFTFAASEYPELERFLQHSFFYKKNILKLFFSPKEENDFYYKSDSESIKPFIQEEKIDWRAVSPSCKGGFSIRGGYVDTSTLMKAFRNCFEERNLLIGESFDHKMLECGTDHLAYMDLRSRKIIFCEGYLGASNPFFGDLPFALSKGEILTVKIEKDLPDRIISRGISIIPLGERIYRVGSTYTREELDEQPEEKAREELCRKLYDLVKAPFEVIEHKASVRPTVRDRRPLIGHSSCDPRIYLFNGLGSKGVLLAPYFARQLTDHLERNTPLDPLADIRRFDRKSGRVIRPSS